MFLIESAMGLALFAGLAILGTRGRDDTGRRSDGWISLFSRSRAILSKPKLLLDDQKVRAAYLGE
ncbi:TPA: hypothetical protein ACU967_003631 [Burkholderia contaminans]|uniref:Uncharacterized protein n=2 Tax=Burkholderia contaminans TaxID=488447 RepID=A0AAP4R716_9BURK|nr:MULTISPECIES: hypothetical protein [Burkholderia]MBM6429438.1 hypothetical protein [Burkholderia contaminans]MCA7878547.1 hypothetical protein [Burkholderia contaminans]MDN7568673.1 hypothetical protein [Burkholderia contaminans]MDN8025314.1 hypothetical protein [Burkholderia contaminans]